MAEHPSRDGVYQIVTNAILERLEAGTVPWHQPWDVQGLPRSLSTRRPYRGVNVFLLGLEAMDKGYSSPWWGTYDQIKARGGQVRKGEKGTLVVFWKRYVRRVTDEDTGEESEKSAATLRYFKVFNADQADDLKVPKTAGAIDREHEPIEGAEIIVAEYFDRHGAPTLRHGGDRAFYRKGDDLVSVPKAEAHHSPAEYYSTIFHEMGHSTGHPSRLNREGIVEGHRFGDRLYSAEELVAEMTAAMLAGIAGIEQLTVDGNAAYIDNWRKALGSDPKLVVSAAAKAQRASDFILGITYEAEASEPVKAAA